MSSVCESAWSFTVPVGRYPVAIISPSSPDQFLLCGQQNLRLSGESPALPTIKKNTILCRLINIAGVATAQNLLSYL
jgi:hypothetical protein